MTLNRDNVLHALASVSLPGGGSLVEADLVRAVEVEGGTVRFVN